MDFQVKEIKLSELVFDESIYPRVDGHAPTHVQQLFENLESLEREEALIVINQACVILNGRHRHLALLKKADGEDFVIKVKVVETRDSLEDEDIAYELDAKAALGYTKQDRISRCRKLYNRGFPPKTIAEKAMVSVDFATKATKAQRDDDKKQLDKKIFNLYLACYTEDEIAEEVNLTQQAITKKIESLTKNNLEIKICKTLANFQEEDFQVPIYSVWNFHKKSNEVSHFGNSEQQILDNLLYLYTNPFDIVLDPFAGGGATIDVCKKRLRRYWISDRKPIVERENEIRKLDIVQELPPLNKRWSEVTLTYLDPPYWRQAQNQYSKDSEDLANMPLEDFTKHMVDIINNIATKQSKGVIAMLMQPTQWNADNREFTDHIFDIIQGVKNKNLILENRVSCPYSTEQANAQMVNWAKENKKLLVISRELIIWRFK